MPYLAILACTLSVLAWLWWPELSRRPAGSHAATGAAPDGWEPYARSFGRHEPRHASPRFYLPVGNYLRRAIASAALVVAVTSRRLAPVTLQAA